MKTKALLLLLAICGLCILPNAAAFEPPSDSQLEKALANPDDTLPSLLKGATGEEVADIVERLIIKIQESEKLTDLQKEYNTAYLVAKVTRLLSGDRRNEFARALLAIEWEPALRKTIIAALSVGGTGSNTFNQFLMELVGENEEELAIIKNPNQALTNSVYSRLIVALGLAPAEAADAIPPPVAIPYQGQRPR
jgi:hypothetical protein